MYNTGVNILSLLTVLFVTLAVYNVDCYITITALLLVTAMIFFMIKKSRFKKPRDFDPMVLDSDHLYHTLGFTKLNQGATVMYYLPEHDLSIRITDKHVGRYEVWMGKYHRIYDHVPTYYKLRQDIFNTTGKII